MKNSNTSTENKEKDMTDKTSFLKQLALMRVELQKDGSMESVEDYVYGGPK